MTENMKEARDNNKVCAAVLADFSKAFGCLLHDLIIAKLYAFGFDLNRNILFISESYINMKIKLNFYFTLLCGASKGFMKALKTFIKPFEAPQRSVKIKI